ncbi:hypothetical protein [Deinococcus navajonensis]|uniref:EAL domain-containing protein n=1 Tax=Deinococcus navajonensis TaxID=309884 RepID=A0ABV8XNE1_9DEIO
MHDQPQVALPSGEVVALEALAHWPQEKNAGVAPLVLTPLGEESGLIQALGE